MSYAEDLPDTSLLTEDEYEELFQVYQEMEGLMELLHEQDGVDTDYDNPPEPLQRLHEAGALKYTIHRDRETASLTGLGRELLEKDPDSLEEFMQEMIAREEELEENYSE